MILNYPEGVVLEDALQLGPSDPYLTRVLWHCSGKGGMKDRLVVVCNSIVAQEAIAAKLGVDHVGYLDQDVAAFNAGKLQHFIVHAGAGLHGYRLKSETPMLVTATFPMEESECGQWVARSQYMGSNNKCTYDLIIKV